MRGEAGARKCTAAPATRATTKTIGAHIETMESLPPPLVDPLLQLSLQRPNAWKCQTAAWARVVGCCLVFVQVKKEG
jgi:hypothetical protein